jgi:hypothetical protein
MFRYSDHTTAMLSVGFWSRPLSRPTVWTNEGLVPSWADSNGHEAMKKIGMSRDDIGILRIS